MQARQSNDCRLQLAIGLRGFAAPVAYSRPAQLVRLAPPTLTCSSLTCCLARQLPKLRLRRARQELGLPRVPGVSHVSPVAAPQSPTARALCQACVVSCSSLACTWQMPAWRWLPSRPSPRRPGLERIPLALKSTNPAYSLVSSVLSVALPGCGAPTGTRVDAPVAGVSDSGRTERAHQARSCPSC